MDKSDLDMLIDRYNTNIKHHMKEISRPPGVVANYMIDIAKTMKGKDSVTEQDIIEEANNYAWDLSPWFKDPYPYKFFEVYSYYEAYEKLTQEEKNYIKENK